MPATEAQLLAIAKYDKENYQQISFKAPKGSRDRIKEAAEATGQSVNSFIKNAISTAMMEAIGKPLEPTADEAGKTTMLRIFDDVLEGFTFTYGQDMLKKIKSHYVDIIENDPSEYKQITEILSSDLSPREKKKRIKQFGKESFVGLQSVIADMYDEIVSNHHN